MAGVLVASRAWARRRLAGHTSPRPTHGYVFVVTYGRSGSTLTQGLLNALPGTLVRGENGLFVVHLFRAWDGLRDLKDKHAANARRGARSAFFGIDEMRPAAFVRHSRSLTLAQLYGETDPSTVEVLGFKEVRWHLIDPAEVERFFAFFESIFPGARYVLNTRDLDQVLTSGFWQNQEPDAAHEAVSRVEEVQRYLAATRPDRTLETRYEQLTSDDAAVSDRALRELAEFTVGRCDEAMLATLRSTRQEGHGPRPFGRSRVGSGAADR